MAYSLKVLEKTAGTDVIDAMTHIPNLFLTEDTGYTGSTGTVALNATLHKWTITGTSTVQMYWKYTTAVAYVANRIIFMRARVKATSAGLSLIALAVAGSTSGVVLGSGTGRISNPTSGTTYDLYCTMTMTGLVGNLAPSVYVTDPTAVTGKSVEIMDWVAIDITLAQGAGSESSAADIYAWILFAFSDWTWLDWYYYGTGINRYFVWYEMPAHGLATGDMIENTGATLPSFIKWWSVYRLDANWIACPGNPSWSGAAATVNRYSQVDRTNRLMVRSLQIDLRSDIEAQISCSLLGNATWQPLAGMTVLLYNGTELIHAGKIKEVTRTINYTTYWKCDISIGTFTEMAIRATYDTATVLDNLSSGAAVEALRMNGMNYKAGFAFARGRIDAGIADIGEYDPTGRSIIAMLNELADAAGFVWYIDKYRRLHFRTPLVAGADAAHALVDGNGYTDYKDVTYKQTTDQYRTRQDVLGAYNDDGTRVRSTRSLDDLAIAYPISTDVEACGAGYTAVAKNESLQADADAQASADAQLYVYGTQVPSTIEFDSGSVDWRPNTKLTVLLATLGISASIYFNIDSVQIYDADGVNFRAKVTASQRDNTTFASVPNGGSSEYLANLMTAAQNSAGAVKQSAGVFAPEFVGSGTPGTWTWTTKKGFYCRHGNLVYVNIRLIPASISGSPTGNLRLLGLPFTIATMDADLTQQLEVFASGLNWGASMTKIDLILENGLTSGIMYGSGNNIAWGAVPVANITVADDIRIKGIYQIIP